jgi:hypothetical protein
MKWYHYTALVGVILAAGLVGGFYAVKHALVGRVRPPHDVRDITAFVRWRPQTTQFAILQSSAGEYLITTGDEQSLLPSGPSAYVFDRNGQLTDWSYDIGDDPAFDARWNAQTAVRGERIVRAAALADWLAGSTLPDRQ